MRPICSSETSVLNQPTLRNISEDGRSQVNRSESGRSQGEMTLKKKITDTEITHSRTQKLGSPDTRLCESTLLLRFDSVHLPRFSYDSVYILVLPKCLSSASLCDYYLLQAELQFDVKHAERRSEDINFTVKLLAEFHLHHTRWVGIDCMR